MASGSRRSFPEIEAVSNNARYFGILLGFAALVAAGVVGVGLMWPWLLAENFRLTWLELGLTWLAEGVAALWFLYFAVRFAITSETEGIGSDSMTVSGGAQAMAILVIFAAAVDLGATFYFEAQEKKARATAVAGVCRIEQVKMYSVKTQRIEGASGHGGTPLYHSTFTAFAWCQLIDAEKQSHRVYYYGKSSRFPEKPQDVRDAVMRGRLPAEMPVQYDPTRPRRFWVIGDESGGAWSGWRLSQEVTAAALVFSLIVIVLQKALFALAIPWEICPLMGAIGRLLIGGIAMCINGQTTLPPLA